jgi:hypothetical protein
MLPPKGSWLISTTRTGLHSMLTRDSRTRGDSTRSRGTGVNPETSNSSTSGKNSADVALICGTMSSETMLTTKSPVPSYC